MKEEKADESRWAECEASWKGREPGQKLFLWTWFLKKCNLYLIIIFKYPEEKPFYVVKLGSFSWILALYTCLWVSCCLYKRMKISLGSLRNTVCFKSIWIKEIQPEIAPWIIWKSEECRKTLRKRTELK
jgi:hypothetical protein